MAVVGDVDRWAHNAEPAGEPAVIAVRDLRMRYGSVDVLKGIGFTARRGEVITLLGPNGAGKTTTIEIIFVPSLLLIPELTGIGLTGWLTFLWVLALGLLATLPIGAVIGSLAKSLNTVNGSDSACARPSCRTRPLRWRSVSRGGTWRPSGCWGRGHSSALPWRRWCSAAWHARSPAPTWRLAGSGRSSASAEKMSCDERDHP